MDDISDIREMYNAGWDKEDDRLERHQLERDLTWLYLEAYLPKHGCVLEIGASTGRYTLELARRGYEVLAIDLAPDLVVRARERVIQSGLESRIEFRVGDARNLAGVPRSAYDAVLLMGPLYHLVLREDRLLALKQAYDCLKPGGVLFSAFISRFGILGDVLKKIPEYIHEQKQFDSILERGRDTEDSPGGPDGFRAYFATVEEIAPLHREAGFEELALAGVEPAISADDESYNRLEGETRRLWLNLFYKVSAEPSMIASSQHILYVGQKIT